MFISRRRSSCNLPSKVVIVIRTWAVWHRNRVIGLGLGAIMIANLIFSCVITNRFIKSMECALIGFHCSKFNDWCCIWFAGCSWTPIISWVQRLLHNKDWYDKHVARVLFHNDNRDEYVCHWFSWTRNWIQRHYSLAYAYGSQRFSDMFVFCCLLIAVGSWFSLPIYSLVRYCAAPI